MENMSSLYEIQCRAVIPFIESFEEVVATESCNHDIAVAASNKLTLVQDYGATCSSINLDCKADALCWSSDGIFLAISDSTGFIHILSSEEFKVLYSEQIFDIKENLIENNEPPLQRLSCVTFTKSYSGRDLYNLAAASSNGKVYTIEQLDIFSLLQGVPLSTTFKTNESFKRKFFDASEFHTEKLSSLLSYPTMSQTQYLTAGYGDHVIATWEKEHPVYALLTNTKVPYTPLGSVKKDFIQRLTKNFDFQGFDKLQQMYSSVFALCNKGHIYMFEISHLVMLKWWPVTFQDFIVKTPCNLVSSDGVKLCRIFGLTKNPEDDCCTISIHKVKNMEKIFSTSCEKNSIFVATCRVTDDIYAIDRSDDSNEEQPVGLCIKKISKASPDGRLLHLLQQHKFVEAIDFATKHKLDRQPVYQQEASHLLRALSVASDGNLAQSTFEKFKQCASKITNTIFVGDLCIRVSLSDLTMTFQLLTLARDHLDSSGRRFRASVGDEVAEDMELCLEMDRLLDLLVTYRMAFKEGDGISWENFRSKKLSSQVAALLFSGNLRAATVICSRHENELISYLEEDGDDRFKNLLKVVSSDVDTDELVIWLEHIIPAILCSSIPQSVEILTAWLHDRAMALEDLCPQKWPENGFKLANVFFKVQSKLSNIGFIREQLSSAYLVMKSKKENVSKLRLLTSRLQLLIRLLSRYKCHISLGVFVQETTLTLTFRMLDGVTAPELVPKCLETTVRPYMKEHHLDEDHTLLQYIKEELGKGRKQARGAFQSIRERKVVSIVKCLQTKKVIVEATAELAKVASIPWSQDVNALVQNAIDVAETERSDVSIASANDECKEMYSKWRSDMLHCVHLERVPVISAKYDLGEVPVRDDASLKRLVRLLIKQDSEEGLTDAVQIAHTFSNTPQEFVYVQRIKHLIYNQRVPECIEVVEKLPDIAVQLVNRTIAGAKVVLECTHPMWAAERTSYCQAAINMVEHMLREVKHLSSCLRHEWTDDLSLLKSIFVLQTRYGEIVSIRDYSDKRKREALLARSIMQHYKQKEAAALSASALLPSNVADMSNSSNVGNTTVVEQRKPAADVGVSGGDAKRVVQGRETFAAVLGVARQLKIPLNTMQSQIALQAAKKCQIKAALDICRDLFCTSPTKATASVLRSVVLIFLSFLKTHPDRIFPFISDICEMVRCAATCCHDNELLNVVALFNLCASTLDVHSATDAYTKDVLSKCMASGPKARRSDRINWANSWYEETDGLTLNSTDVLPLVAQLAERLFDKQGLSLSCSSASGKFSRNLVALGDLVVQMTGKLKNTRHCTMALQWVLKMQCAMVAYLSNHEAFYGESKEAKMVVEMLMNIVKQANIEMKGYMEVLVEKILLSRKPDVPLAVGFLLGLPPKLAFQLLDNFCESASTNFSKITAISQTGLQVSRLHGDLAQAPRYEQLLLDAKWAQDLNERKIPVDGFLFSSPQWKMKFLLKLICYSTISGSILYDYCRDYHLDCDSALLQYVAVLLGCDAPSLDSGAVARSPDNCVVEYTQMLSPLLPINHSPLAVHTRKGENVSAKEDKRAWERVKEELKWVTQHVKDIYELQRRLELCLRNSMCPYDYDRAEFMLKLIESCASATEGIVNVDKGLKLIGYLRHVTRQRPPSEYETRRLWRDGSSDSFSSSNLPVLAQTRLPLHPLLYGDASHAWKVISNEVTERTAEFLAPIAKLLRLSEDKLYMTAADNVISSYMINNKDKVNLASWQLERIQSLTEKITSRNMAVAMAKRIAENLPAGEEKVTAYKWCVSLVTKWREALPADSPDMDAIANALQVFEWNSRNAATEMFLAKYGLDSAENRKLMNQPTNLILHLYKHPSVIQRFYEPGHNYPDLHELVDHVTKIHQLDGPKIRLAMIQNLLLAANKQNQAPAPEDESTIDIERLRSAALVQESSSDVEEKELVQLLYLLSYDNPIAQARHLLKLFDNSKNRRITNNCRVRALHCLFHIIDDDETLLKLTSKTADDLRSDLRVLVYLTELEAADFKIPVSHLRQSDKSSIARSVIASSARRHNPLALRAAAEMCREFGSVPPDTWVVLLQQLVALQQVSYLQQLLPDICRIPAVRSLPCLASVWQSCVTIPLVSLTSPLNNKQRDVALASYRFLLRCPVLLRINLSSVAQHFSALELHVLALGCLLISPSDLANAKNFAKTVRNEIRNELPQLHTEDQPLLGHDLIDAFLKDL